MNRIAAAVLLALLLALLHLGGLARERWQVLDGRLGDPDGYMRLVRVAELQESGDWYAGRVMRANVPYGQSQHWTRPFDVLLLAGGAALAPWLGFDRGLFAWAALSGPLLHLATLLVLLWSASSLLSRPALAVTGLMALFQPAITASFFASRPDHHGLQALVFAGLLGAGVRLLQRPERWRLAVLAGLLAAFAVWISVEGLVAAILLAAALAAAWLVRGGRTLEAGLAVALAAAVGATVALMLERPPTEWLSAEYDRLSIPHLALFSLHAATWLGLWLAAPRLDRPGRRLLALAGAGTLALAVLFISFPKLAAGPMVDVPERVRAIWLPNIAELASIWSVPDWRQGLYLLLLYLGSCLAAMGYMAWRLRDDSDAARPAWAFLLLLAAVYSGLALHQVRWAVYAEIAALPAFGLLTIGCLEHLGLGFGTRASSTPRLLVLSLGRLVLLAGFGLGFAALAWAVRPGASVASAPGTTTPVVRTCDVTGIARHLFGLDGPKRRILTFIFDGPELLYRTRHDVVATPYHRNGAGILDTYDTLTATDVTTARTILGRRGVDWVLLCPRGSEGLLYRGGNGPTMFERWSRGEVPDWLVPVALPAPWREEFLLLEARR